MPVRMVRIRHMRMDMLHWCMQVTVAVTRRWERGVVVIVMAVVMTMRMLVFQCFMGVRVPV